jgi:hypothetical protein
MTDWISTQFVFRLGSWDFASILVHEFNHSHDDDRGLNPPRFIVEKKKQDLETTFHDD